MKKRFRNFSAKYYAKFLMLSGAVGRAKSKALRGDYILSIYFHNPSKKEFKFVITWLRKEGFHFISVAELIDIMDGTRSFPKGAVLLTVDDGWASNVENIVSVADNEGVPVTIFITTGAVESGNYWFNYAKKANRMGLGYPGSEALKQISHQKKLAVLKKIKESVELSREAMTVSDVQKIAASPYITIGGHTVNHPILPNCSDQEARFETIHCKTVIEEWLGEKVETFAYPNGSFGEREIEFCQEANYKIAFANNPGFITQRNLKDKYKIPRVGFLEGASNAENICRMMGVWHAYSTKLFT